MVAEKQYGEPLQDNNKKLGKRAIFLGKLDSAVWVEKRLFPARLIVLDEVQGSHGAQDFIVDVIMSIPQTLNVMDSLPSTKDSHFLERAALEARVQLKLEKIQAQYSQCPFSILEQFMSDLNLYGLREALAYLFEYPGYTVNEGLEQFMTTGYHDIGQRFLSHSKLIQQRLKETYLKFIKSKGKPLPNIVDRLIVGDAINFNDPWADGQRQENLAALQ